MYLLRFQKIPTFLLPSLLTCTHFTTTQLNIHSSFALHFNLHNIMIHFTFQNKSKNLEQRHSSMELTVMESLRRCESSKRRLRNKLARRTEGDGKIDYFTRRFIQDKAMNKNIKVVCRGLRVRLGQNAIVAKCPHTAFDIFFHKCSKTG